MEEITHAQLSYDAQHQPQYIVHHIQYGTPSNFTQTVNKALLQEGANLVKQVRTEEIWHNVEIKAGYHTPALIICVYRRDFLFFTLTHSTRIQLPELSLFPNLRLKLLYIRPLLQSRRHLETGLNHQRTRKFTLWTT